MSCEQLFGMGSDNAKEALQRACRLLDDVPRHPARGALLFRLGFMLSVRSEHADALALAERIEALAQETDDPALLIAACTIQGEVQLCAGTPASRGNGSNAVSRRAIRWAAPPKGLSSPIRA